MMCVNVFEVNIKKNLFRSGNLPNLKNELLSQPLLRQILGSTLTSGKLVICNPSHTYKYMQILP